MSDTADPIAEVAAQTAQLLRYQADEFGVVGLDVPAGVLTARAAPVRPTASAVPAAAAAPAAAAPQSLRPPAGGIATLKQVAEELGDCTRCKLCKGRTSIVFGVGDPAARLMFVGEGPGRDEDLQGEPFVGPAGQLLDRMIAAMGLKRHQVYIANIVKCRPPRNRPPEPDEVAACEPFLVKQIAAIKPDYLVALGACAAQTLLRDSTAIGRLRGSWRMYDGIPLMPTFHPAYLLRNPADKRLVWQDLQQVMAKLGLQPGAEKS